MTRELEIHKARHLVVRLTRKRKAAERLVLRLLKGEGPAAPKTDEAARQLSELEDRLKEAEARVEELGPSRHQRYYRKNREDRKRSAAQWRLEHPRKYGEFLARKRREYSNNRLKEEERILRRLANP